MGSNNSKEQTIKEAFKLRGYEYDNDIIGIGGNGLICAVEKDNIKYAAKLQIIKDKKNKKLIKQENKILEELQDSEYIIQSVDNFQYRDSSEKLDVIVMEKMDVDLIGIIENNFLSLRLRKWVFYQICQAIQHCHSKSIWHLDIKADNVLVKMKVDNKKIKRNNNYNYKKENIKIKLTDFGHARRSGDKIPRNTGTDEYSPPEVIKCKEKYLPKSFRGDKMDIWCLGVLLFTLMTGYFPYKIDNDGNRMYHFIGENLKKFIDDNECRDLLGKILCEYPNARCSIDEIISHPWFNNM